MVLLSQALDNVKNKEDYEDRLYLILDGSHEGCVVTVGIDPKYEDRDYKRLAYMEYFVDGDTEETICIADGIRLKELM